MQLWKKAESEKRELTDGRCRLKIVENMCASIKHVWFFTEEAR